MTAISALIHLDIPVNYICSGLKNTYWPARLQKIEKGNLFNLITDYNVKNELFDLFPKLKNGQLLGVPITTGDNPLCAFFIKDVSRQSELIDYGKLL